MSPVITGHKWQRFLRTRAVLGTILALAAIAAGALTAQSPLRVVFVVFLTLAWFVLVRFYEAALAILLVGFFLYPTLLEFMGMNTSSSGTILFYTFLTSAALVGGIGRKPKQLYIVLRRRGTRIGLILAAWSLINSTMFSWGNDLALKKLGLMVFLMIIPLIIAQFVTENELRRFYWLCVGLILLGTMLTIRNLLNAELVSESRISVNENTSPLGFAYSTGLVALMALGLLASGNTSKSRRLPLWIQLTTTAVIFVASGSRGPIVALGAGMMVMLFKASSGMRKFVLIAIGAGSLIAWLALRLVPNMAYVRLASVISAASSGELNSAFAASRGTIWALSLFAWLSSPWFGIGLGNFMQYGQGLASFSHNFILEVLTELGVVGLLILSFFLWNLGKASSYILRHNKTNTLQLSLIALLAYSIVSMSFSGQLQASVDFWMISAFIGNLNLRQEELAPHST